jgi:ribosome maturation factor RimP
VSSRTQAIEQKALELLQPVLDQGGYELVDLEYVREAGTWYLRAYCDKEGGITVDDCEIISHAFETRLDEADLIDAAYILEVSSPGLGRPLKKEKLRAAQERAPLKHPAKPEKLPNRIRRPHRRLWQRQVLAEPEIRSCWPV